MNKEESISMKRSPLSGLTDVEAIEMQRQGFLTLWAIDQGLMTMDRLMNLSKKVNGSDTGETPAAA